MLLVILGAGASVDSGEPFQPTDARPPLANQLFQARPAFDEAVRHFPACRPALSHLRHAGERGGGAVEELLRTLQEQEDTYPERTQHINAVRFYLQEILEYCSREWLLQTAGITNYVSLVDILANWRHESGTRVLIVTFNYDTLIESALQDVLHFQFNHISDYVSRSDFTLIKPHGSVNWGRLADWKHEDIPLDLRGRQAILNHSKRLDITTDFTLLRHIDDVFGTDGGRRAVRFPAIAIPVDRKSQFECPAEHLEVLRNLLPEARKVLIVGWRATEEHFLSILQDKLRGKSRDMLVVAETEESARATTENLFRASLNLLPAGTYQVPLESGIRMSGLVRGTDQDILQHFLRSE